MRNPPSPSASSAKGDASGTETVALKTPGVGAAGHSIQKAPAVVSNEGPDQHTGSGQNGVKPGNNRSVA